MHMCLEITRIFIKKHMDKRLSCFQVHGYGKIIFYLLKKNDVNVTLCEQYI
jgi:hypothetical protein